MSAPRVIIQWTETAKDSLARLPRNARKGLLAKADTLFDCSDPRNAFKPLTGPLSGYYRITYGRYRAIYTVEEEELTNGETVITIRIRFVAAGIRKESDKKDVYNFALRLLERGLLDESAEKSQAEGKKAVKKKQNRKS